MAEEGQKNAAHHVEDKIGWTMMCIKAVERINSGTIEEFVAAYLFLAEIIDPANPNTRTLPSYQKLRDHAVILARTQITTDFNAIQNDYASLDLQAKGRRKENILVKLKRILPGGTTGLNAMADDKGQIRDRPVAGRPLG